MSPDLEREVMEHVRQITKQRERRFRNLSTISKIAAAIFLCALIPINAQGAFQNPLPTLLQIVMSLATISGALSCYVQARKLSLHADSEMFQASLIEEMDLSFLDHSRTAKSLKDEKVPTE
jgi:hypothetical protein